MFLRSIYKDSAYAFKLTEQTTYGRQIYNLAKCQVASYKLCWALLYESLIWLWGPRKGLSRPVSRADMRPGADI